MRKKLVSITRCRPWPNRRCMYFSASQETPRLNRRAGSDTRRTADARRDVKSGASACSGCGLWVLADPPSKVAPCTDSVYFKKTAVKKKSIFLTRRLSTIYKKIIIRYAPPKHHTYYIGIIENRDCVFCEEDRAFFPCSKSA